MHVYLKNNPTKFRSGPVLNDVALGFFQEVARKRTGKWRARWVAIWDQFLIQKLLT